VRRDTELRLQILDQRLAGARSADDFIALLVYALEELVREDPESIAVLFELFTLSRRNDEIAAELAELLRRTRDHVAGLLAAKQNEGVLRLRAAPEAITDVLFSLSDGVAMRMLTDPAHDFSATVSAGALAVRVLLDDRG
jgi:hypothetical protein